MKEKKINFSRDKKEVFFFSISKADNSERLVVNQGCDTFGLSLFNSKACQISIKMWPNLHENSGFALQKDTHQGHTCFLEDTNVGTTAKRLFSVAVMTTVWSRWLLWLHADTMNVLSALSTTPVMFAEVPEEESFQSDCTRLYICVPSENIFDYFTFFFLIISCICKVKRLFPHRARRLSGGINGVGIYSYEPSFHTHSSQCCPLQLWFISLWPGREGEGGEGCVCVRLCKIKSECRWTWLIADSVSRAGMWEIVCHLGEKSPLFLLL